MASESDDTVSFITLLIISEVHVSWRLIGYPSGGLRFRGVLARGRLADGRDGITAVYGT